MRKITFDIETKNTFQDIGTRDPSSLDLSLIAIHDSETDEYTAFLEDELSSLWPILERADALIGFNSNHFDLPLLDKYYPGDLFQIKSVDLLAEIKQSLGRRIGLDAIAQATLGLGKSGHGLQAIEWWHNGEIEKLRDYCIQDVKVTKQVYDYAKENGYLVYESDTGLARIPLDTSSWEVSEEGAMTHTLPF